MDSAGNAPAPPLTIAGTAAQRWCRRDRVSTWTTSASCRATHRPAPDPAARSGGWKPAVATVCPGPPESTRTITAPVARQTRTRPGMVPCRNALAMTSPPATSRIRDSPTDRPSRCAASPTRWRASARSPIWVSLQFQGDVRRDRGHRPGICAQVGVRLHVVGTAGGEAVGAEHLRVHAGDVGQHLRGVAAAVVQAYPRVPVAAEQLGRGHFGPEVGGHPAGRPIAPAEVALGQQPGRRVRRPASREVVANRLGRPAEMLIAQAWQAPADPVRVVAEPGADDLLRTMGHDRDDGFAALQAGSQERQHAGAEILVRVVEGGGMPRAGRPDGGDGRGHRPCTRTRDSLTMSSLPAGPDGR